LFPARSESRPTIYAYEDNNPQFAGMLKVGYTVKSAKERVAAQYPIQRPGDPTYRIVLEEAAMRADGTSFTDHDVHRVLLRKGFHREAGEWFRCAEDDVRAAITALVLGTENDENRTRRFGLRPEQEAAIEKTAAYFA